MKTGTMANRFRDDAATKCSVFSRAPCTYNQPISTTRKPVNRIMFTSVSSSLARAVASVARVSAASCANCSSATLIACAIIAVTHALATSFSGSMGYGGTLDPVLAGWGPSVLFGAVAAGMGYGEEGEGFVRIAMVENEQRIRQAARNVKRFLAERG